MSRRWPSLMIAHCGSRISDCGFGIADCGSATRNPQPAIRDPTRKWATSSIGFCVADRPIRSSGCSATCCRRSSDSVDLVDDDGLGRAQGFAAALARHEEIERFRSGNHEARWTAHHGRALRAGGVAGAHCHPHLGCVEAELGGDGCDLGQRPFEVLGDVDGQRLERRDVDDADFIGQRAGDPFPDEVVERSQKGRERLARSSWRGNERVPPGADRRPALRLRPCRLAQCFGKPAGDDRMELRQRHHG